MPLVEVRRPLFQKEETEKRPKLATGRRTDHPREYGTVVTCKQFKFLGSRQNPDLSVKQVPAQNPDFLNFNS